MVHADGSPADPLNIQVRVGTEHYRFMPDGPQLSVHATPSGCAREFLATRSDDKEVAPALVDQ